MPVASEDGQSSDVFFNPFAVDEPLKSSFTPPPIPSGNVALRPKRRRGSGSDTTATSASTGINAVADFRSHTRAHTEAYADIYSSSHPLRSAGVASGSNLESITRPNLARMVEVGILVDAPSIDETYDGESILEAKASSTEEKDVLVHEVSKCFAGEDRVHEPSPRISDILTRLIGWCRPEVRNQSGGTKTSEPSVVV